MRKGKRGWGGGGSHSGVNLEGKGVERQDNFLTFFFRWWVFFLYLSIHLPPFTSPPSPSPLLI